MTCFRPAPCVVAAALLALVHPAAARAATVKSVVDTFANAAIQDGSTEGLEIAVVIGTARPQFFSFGAANVATQAAPDADTLFQIASVTKVFTTNLLGQAVAAKTHALTDPLSSFSAQLGALPPHTAAVTLQDLGDFTGGFPTYAPLCAAGQKPSVTGCLPGTPRPTTVQYTGADMAAFFRTYKTAGAPPLPYLYSDFSLGLLGLLLGAAPGAPLTNSALAGWETLLSTQLLHPLRLASTFTDVPPKDAVRLAPGYTQALASAVVANGRVTGLTPIDPGVGYTTAPAVTISGGGGSGATAIARVKGGSVAGYTITDHGTGYSAPPVVTFSSGTAQATAIIQGGHVIGVSIQSGGSYTSVPTVTFSGGQKHGRDAKGTVFVDHDQVTYVQVTDIGAGYVDPIEVSIAPGAPTSLPVPIWAPAGALKSSARDLATFAAAALGHTAVGSISVPAAVTAGFATAETPVACEAGSPSLTGCTARKSGLAWDINTAAPLTLAKDGGLPGYSSYVVLQPAQNAAVIVLANSRNEVDVAPQLGTNIIYALNHMGLLAPAPR